MSSLSGRGASGGTAHILTDPAPRRVAVLRALYLGDMLCAVPALRALRRALPDATISLIGLPWARSFTTRFAAYVDEFVEFPGFEGLPEQDVNTTRLVRFIREMRDRELDLAIQLHGSGSFVNECIALLEARRSAGFFRPGDAIPDAEGFIPWPASGSETDRLLSLVRHLGADTSDDTLELPLSEEDWTALASTLSGVTGTSSLDASPYVCVHPGARLRSRRWPADRFAAVADAVTSLGFPICLTGTAEERPITTSVVRAMRNPCIDTSGCPLLRRRQGRRVRVRRRPASPAHRGPPARVGDAGPRALRLAVARAVHQLSGLLDAVLHDRDARPLHLRVGARARRGGGVGGRGIRGVSGPARFRYAARDLPLLCRV